MSEQNSGQSHSETDPLTVADIGMATDESLDERLWLRVLRLLSRDPHEPTTLPPDLRAWYVTRLFEWSYGAEGADAFWDNSPNLSDAVHEGYVRLGLKSSAVAFDELRSTTCVRRLVRDPSYLPSDSELEIIDRMTAAVGHNDEARAEFVRRNPEQFAGI